MSEAEIETRKALACRTFWSDHPLNLAYREICGHRPFTLKEFVAFVLNESADRLANHQCA